MICDGNRKKYKINLKTYKAIAVAKNECLYGSTENNRKNGTKLFLQSIWNSLSDNCFIEKEKDLVI